MKIIVQELISLNIPHNLLISESGKTTYLMLRDAHERMGWLEFGGVYVETRQPQPSMPLYEE